jgi:hypothetical protein
MQLSVESVTGGLFPSSAKTFESSPKVVHRSAFLGLDKTVFFTFPQRKHP